MNDDDIENLWLPNPTPEQWASTLVAGIGVYEEFPSDHPEIWPTILQHLKQHGYRIVKREDALYAERVHD